MHRTTITPVKATEPGALDGFRVDCETCGYIGTSSLRTLAKSMYARGHVEYMARLEKEGNNKGGMK